VLSATPEFLGTGPTIEGRYPVAAVNQDGAMAGFKPNDMVSIYGIGFGMTSPAAIPGKIPDSSAALAAPVSVRLGGEELPADQILYAGLEPGYLAAYKVVIKLPETTPAGDLPVAITNGEHTSPPGAYLPVRRE
jgi:uncharacterized protein (TIGR03437 family)